MENTLKPDTKEFFHKRLNPQLSVDGGFDRNNLIGGVVGGNLRRPLTTTVATAGVQHRRVIKKHIQQKYLLCGFAIHAFLCTPAYLYGNVVESDKDLVMRIWPAIVYQATGELCRNILENLDIEYHGYNKETIKYRRIFLLATLIICCSLMIAGILFSSAWIRITTETQIIAIIFYGFFGGIGSSLFIWKTHVILEAVRPREDKFVRKTIHLCGEAFCQLCLSFAFTNLRTLYGTAQSIILMSALLVNLIPISLIITRHRQDAITSSSYISILKHKHHNHNHNHNQNHNQLGHYSSNLTDQLDGIEMKTWKNPSNIYNYHNNATRTVKGLVTATATLPSAPSAPSMPTVPTTNTTNDNDNFLLSFHNDYRNHNADDNHNHNDNDNVDDINLIILNPNGVEIMEIIPEEEDDENISIIRSSSATINNYDKRSIENSQILTNKFITNVPIKQASNNSLEPHLISNLNKLPQFFHNIFKHLWPYLYGKIFQPLSIAICIPKLYMTTFLSSTDIFSYIMCLTVLPGLAVNQHAIKNAEIPFLFSLLAFPWMCFALMTPRFGNSLFKHKIQWHSLGCTCKALALTFISISNSKLLLSVSAVLLGFGQAVTLFLQEWIFQLNMSYTHWMAIRYPVHLTNAIFILSWGAMAHWIVVHFSFQASVALAAALYTCSILLWYTTFLFS